MEPIELGLLGVGLWFWKNGGEKLTKEVVDEYILPPIKERVLALSQTAREKMVVLGDRIRGRLAGKDPLENPVLVAEIVEEEAKEPQVAEAIAAVEAQLPSQVIENWKGINVKGGTNTISGNKFTF